MLSRYRHRVAKPSDWVKQPFLDVLRWVSAGAARALGSRAAAAPPPPPNRILVIRRNNLGDAVSTLPLLQGLKAERPGRVIDVLANPYNAEVFRRSPAVDTVFEVPESWLGNRLGVAAHPALRRLRRGPPYDLVLNASASYSSHAVWLAWLVPAAFRVGVAAPRGALWDRVWDVPVPMGREEYARHQVVRLAHVAAHGAACPARLPAARLSVAATRQPGRVLLCPQVRRARSRWPDAAWQRLAAALVVDGWSVAWLGQCPPGHEQDTLCTPPDTGALIDCLGEASLAICSEGGVSHLAPAAGTPAIVLSGMAVRETWLPWSEHAVLLERTGAVESIEAAEVLAQVRSWQAGGCFAYTPNAWLGRSDG